MSGRGRSVAEEINSKVNIVELISSYVDLKRAGKNHKGLCPFHGEKTPSFTVSEERGMYYCFGCKASGDAISFIMNMENLDFIEAVKLLAERYSIDISSFGGRSGDKDLKNEMLYLAKVSANFFYKQLKSSRRGMEYLNSRGVTGETIKKFGIGYAADSWDSLLKYFEGVKGADLKKLKAIGLLSEKKNDNGYFDVFRDRIIFPIQNIQGKVIGFGGRVIADAHPKYLNSPESLIFDKSGILYGLNLAKNYPESKRRIVVVEGYMDVIMLNQAGFVSAVATLGTSLTDKHAQTLARYTEEIVLCYDGDSAGINAAIRGVGVLKNSKCPVRVLLLPEGKDPDEYVNSYGLDGFQALLDKADNMFTFYLKNLHNKYKGMGENAIIRVITDYLMFISDVESPAEREIQMKKLSDMTGISLETVREELIKLRSGAESKLLYNSRHQEEARETDLEEVLVEEREGRLEGGNTDDEVKPTLGLQNKNRKKLYNVELRMLQIALSSRENAMKLFGVTAISSMKNRGIKEAVLGLLEYYEGINEEFSAQRAVDIIELELARKLERQKENMPTIDNIEKEVGLIMTSHQLLLTKIELEEITKLRNKYERISSGDGSGFSFDMEDMSSVEKDHNNRVEVDIIDKINALNRREVELRGVLASLGSLKV